MLRLNIANSRVFISKLYRHEFLVRFRMKSSLNADFFQNLTRKNKSTNHFLVKKCLLLIVLFRGTQNIHVSEVVINTQNFSDIGRLLSINDEESAKISTLESLKLDSPYVEFGCVI